MPRTFDPARPKRVVDYFTKQHLTMREIGVLEKLSIAGVSRILKRMGISSSAGTWVEAVCPVCKQPFRRRRAAFKEARVPTCSRLCYYARRRAGALKHAFYWRQGMRIARKTVKAAGYRLLSTNVVHHVDGNHHNNELANLWVFTDQAAHIAFHHHGVVRPIWRGDLWPFERAEATKGDLDAFGRK